MAQNNSTIDIKGLRALMFAANAIELELHETTEGYLLKVVSDKGEKILRTYRNETRFFKELETAKRFILRELSVNRVGLYFMPRAA